MKNFKIFSGTASVDLAKMVAKILGVSLGKREVVRFADGECRVRIEEEVDGSSVALIQSLSPSVDENLVELLFLSDTLKRNGAKKIIAVVPYLGYARQDKISRKGEGLSAEVLAQIIEGAGVEKLITLDVHSERALSFFEIPTQNLATEAIFAPRVKGEMVIAPDKGAVLRAQRLAKVLGAKVGYLEKDRDLITGRIKILRIKGEVEKKQVVIVDDMLTSGGTIVLAADFLKRAGAASIFACATHALLVKNAPQDLQKSPIEKVFVTDTIPVPKEKQFKKLEIVSVAPLLAQALKEE